MNNSINAPRHIIKFTQFFFYRSIENFLRIDKYFNITLKIRGNPIIIRRITLGIAIIIRGISRKRPRIKITSISIVIKIVLRDKIHIYGSLFCSTKVDKCTSLGSIGVFVLAPNFISASTLSLKVLISSTEFTFLLVGALSVCHCE